MSRFQLAFVLAVVFPVGVILLSGCNRDGSTDRVQPEKTQPVAAAKAPHVDQTPLAPSGIDDEAERNLYLQPGGAYTLADIEANGKQTATQKFKSFVPKHDLKPKVGDKICPITLTKSNPKCTWVVGGKEYQFCCPPCVEEFVKLAKEKPLEIKDPDSYLK